jgi:hypothetical protein
MKLLAKHGLEHFHSGWKCSSLGRDLLPASPGGGDETAIADSSVMKSIALEQTLCYPTHDYATNR